MKNYDLMSIEELELIAKHMPKQERIFIIRAIAKRENNHKQGRGSGSTRALTEVNYGLNDL